MVYGLVGRSGTGKSTAAEIFAKHGFFIIDCDKVAAEVLNNNPDVRKRLAEAFGKDVLTEVGINRPLLATRAFATRRKLDRLNSITHPAIVERIKELLRGREKAIIDAPMLFESGADKLCDKVIAVVASDDVCEKRLLLRDKASKETLKKRLSMQKSEEYLRSAADVIIENGGNFESFKGLVEDVAKTL